MICLQKNPKVDRKKWRHDVIIVTSKLTLWHKITNILYEKIYASTKSAIFHSSRSHSQDTVERFWFNPTAWHCDVMMSQHDAPKLIFPISACRCARKMILFLFLWNFGLLSSKMLSVLYLHDDVTSWRRVMTSKTGGTLSQLVEVLERWFFFFVFIVFRFA